MGQRAPGKEKSDRRLQSLTSEAKVKGNKGNQQKWIDLVETLKRGESIVTEEDHERLRINSDKDRRDTCEAYSLAQNYRVG